ncbi:MAG: ATP-binding protein [Gammaproteobacteria bacterium]|nr:ATP-binding protein [Gammaproteobacteria bacterium]
MSTDVNGPFEHVPKTVAGSFVLYLYAALYRLMKHVNRLSEAGGSDLDALFERYPFLSEYFDEMRRHMPEQISWDEGSAWWREQLTLWQQGADEHMPISALMDEAGLSFESCMAFMITGLVEEDSRFGTLFAELQEPLPHRRPTLEMVGQMMIDDAMVGQADPWVVCRPLLNMGLVEALNKQVPRSEWVLRVPPLLWDVARGELATEPAAWLSLIKQQDADDMDALVVAPELRERLSALPPLLSKGVIQTLILRGPAGSNAREMVSAVARQMGLHLVSVDAAYMDEGEDAQFLGAFCAMAHAMPFIIYDLAPGETVQQPELKGYTGAVAIFMGSEGGLGYSTQTKAVTLNIPLADAELRSAYWHKSLNGHQLQDMDDVVNRFHLSGEYIQRISDIAIAHSLMEGREELYSEDIRIAARTLNRQQLDTLADYIEPQGDWSLLVTINSTEKKLRELQKRCYYREQLTSHLGPAFGSNVNRGVRALFTGASGTGKTMAAKILAAELGMDLYRVDLAAIINKYIGETEKNLHKVLSRAEALDVMLLLDEGDALLGQRTDVKSANDRYANLETNYLLQRLENYQGIVLITTNLVENIDRAFQRRMDIVVPFFSPQAQERLHILDLHLPDEHQIDYSYLEMVSLRCRLTGGQIRSAAMHASLLALDEEQPLERRHMEAALRSEYRKAGGTFPLEGVDEYKEHDGGMSEFMTALGNQ